MLIEDFSPESDAGVLVDLRSDHGLSLIDCVDMRDAPQDIFGRRVDLVSEGGLRNPIRRQANLESAEVPYAA